MKTLEMEDADLETVSLSTDPRFIALIERSRASHARPDPDLVRQSPLSS